MAQEKGDHSSLQLTVQAMSVPTADLLCQDVLGARANSYIAFVRTR